MAGSAPNFQPYGVGKKAYGLKGAPHLGPSGPNAKLGYQERDRKAKAKRSAALRRLKKIQKGRVVDPDVLRRG